MLRKLGKGLALIEKLLGLMILGIILSLTFANNLFAYEEISLNGEWEYALSEQEGPPSEKTKWKEVEVPSLGWGGHPKTVWFRHRFTPLR